MPDWFVIRPTRFPCTSAGGCSTKTSTPGRTTGADAHAEVTATRRAAVRLIRSVTCYASRPRLQPHARSLLGSPFHSERADPGRALDAGAGVLGQTRGERGDFAGRALGGRRSGRADHGGGAERVAHLRVRVCRGRRRAADGPAGRGVGERPRLVAGRALARVWLEPVGEAGPVARGARQFSGGAAHGRDG